MFEFDRLCIQGMRPLSMKIDQGECIGLYGESGSGKSRLLRALADMDPYKGRILLNGVMADSVDASKWRKQVSLLPAESQWWADSVGEHFSDEDNNFSLFGFTDDIVSWQISRCSTGERQRLAILRCLANQPKVLLLDEPTANLDPENSIQVEQLIKSYLQREQAHCVWVSHDRDQLKRIAQKCFQLHDGLLLEERIL